MSIKTVKPSAQDGTAQVSRLRQTFASGKTKSAKWRIEQIQGLAKMTRDHRDSICEMLYKDHRRNEIESGMTASV